ncbi:hypothetical protein SAMN05880501_107199 [Ureibacillus xyleni]|uniref:Uncharacterized protein n=1 Tax=Ureibacillus xyleni TaxID=614648 RepID=A0A285SYP6_9BACL|nr:hypothetical protein [Ureibacillus xyleni]SOC13480.1 hypothetical protein SAMN05880501_107199 [Ureibacillus xyleni]
MSGFQMIIGSTPKGIELKQELHLVKIGLLYADNVTLCSPGATMFSSINELKNLTVMQKMMVFLPYIFTREPELKKYEDVLNLYFYLMDSNRTTRRTLEKKFGIKKIREIESSGKEIQSIIETMLIESGFPELERAFNSGNVILKTFDNLTISEAMMKEYTEFLFDSVREGVHYPLFDELSGNIVSQMIKENERLDLQMNKGSQAKLAQDLFERLPLFEKASVGEILDIRNELDRPLRQFRLAIMEFTNEVKNAWWDKDFLFEAEKVFYKKVEPAVLEIEEQVESVSFLKELNNNMSMVKVGGGAFTGYLLDGMAASTNLNASIIGALIAGGASVVDAIQKTKDQQREIKNNQMYFYYRLRKGFS